MRAASRTLGLAGAVIEGWMSSSAEFVAVIDADLQHDERILPEMYRALAEGRAEALADRNPGRGRPGRGRLPRRRAKNSAVSSLGSFGA